MKRMIITAMLLALIAAAPMSAAQLLLLQSGFSDGSARSASANFVLEQTSGFGFGGQATGTGFLEAGGFYPFGTVVSGVAIGEQGAALPALPRELILQPPYPNPGAQPAMRFGLPRTAHVSLRVYNIIGQEVAALLDGTRAAGWHTARWNGRDRGGKLAAAGVYLLRLQAGDRALTRKLMLVR
jgi:hypothetical protein